MKPLSEMTLLDLASAVALADNGPDHDRYTLEIIRRQRMLDAAEAMFKDSLVALGVLRTRDAPCQQSEATRFLELSLAAYQAAKEDQPR